jgi:dTDP-4-dehydrorhamnose reductase
MKILLLGSTGQVGWELNRTLLTLGELTALDYPQIDMADPKSIRSVVAEHKPDLIINATAYTDVDRAETERDLSMAINGTGPGLLAQEAKKLGSALIHYSTDYVFDGTKNSPYTEEDKPYPINHYGKTKLAGECAIQEVGGIYLIFRTSWVYSLRRPCFVTKVLEWAKTQDVLRIVDDQVSTPTWARTLAEATTQVVAQGRSDPKKSGIYHLTDGGSCSRYEWAEVIFDLAKIGKKPITTPAESVDFPTVALRPPSTILDIRKFIKEFSILQDNGWQKMLELLFP